MDNINQAISGSKTSTPSTVKRIAKALDTQHQETVSIQATKLQDMYNNLNTTIQEPFFTLSMNILEIHDKPLSEIINPKNKSIKNSTRYSTSHSTLWNSIRHKINSHQNSENIDETSFKFNLEKPPGNHYNQERINNYIKFYLKDYNKRSEDLQLWSEDTIRDIIIRYVGYLHKQHMSSKEKIESNKVFNRRRAQKIQCAKLINLDKLGQSLSDIEKVIKPEYKSPEISSKENKEDLCELIQKLDQENEKKERSSKCQKKHKGSPSTLCIEVNQDHEQFDNLKTHLPVALNSDDVNDSIWLAWALPDNHNDTNHDFESDN
ncbi:15467_t:CDS:2 [Dentiscutata erythropus]|uniref:15467_t:CDS:1 n=1 Tax=Dentiscutata erythropus TaxID=1348616 RepID=A0A9N9GNR1_9GLOM|nr:15467_t:CDS:2 [Dentiscutata erythropus]